MCQCVVTMCVKHAKETRFDLPANMLLTIKITVQKVEIGMILSMFLKGDSFAHQDFIFI